jgi:hypothetical protein
LAARLAFVRSAVAIGVTATVTSLLIGLSAAPRVQPSDTFPARPRAAAEPPREVADTPTDLYPARSGTQPRWHAGTGAAGPPLAVLPTPAVPAPPPAIGCVVAPATRVLPGPGSVTRGCRDPPLA